MVDPSGDIRDFFDVTRSMSQGVVENWDRDELVFETVGEAQGTFVDTEGTPDSKFAFVVDSSTYAVACGDFNGAETLVDESLQRMRYACKLVDVEELPRVFRIGNILCYPSQGSIVVETTRPYLRIRCYRMIVRKVSSKLTVPFSSINKLCIPPPAISSKPAPSSPNVASCICSSAQICFFGLSNSSNTSGPSPN